MIKYKKIDEKAWNGFGENLLTPKNPTLKINTLDSEEIKQEKQEKKVEKIDKQKLFLRTCRKGKDDFLYYIKEELGKLDKNYIIDGVSIDFKYKFNEQEFCSPPPEPTQKIIWDAFTDVAQEDMMNCGFWGLVIIDMIKNNCIEPEYLASGSNKDDAYNLDEALRTDDIIIIDSCVRRILRSMCNPAPRDKRIMFNDFSLGKSYWRWNWAHKMSNEIDLDYKEILKIFDETSYADFAGKMHSGKSYISQTNTLGGLLLFLNSSPNPKKKLGKIIDKISFVSAWKAIEIQSPEQNKKEIEKIAEDL